MKPDSQSMIDADWRGADAAMERAANRALEIGRRTGTPVWVMVDGKLVDALAEERGQQNGKTSGEDGTH